ncbi:MAG: protein translocase subunit SecD [Spirochaetales bacterium]|nr:protein translocase subunit SecD [Spirochaetales bacterium]
MSKRFRLLLILLLVGAAGFFLAATVNWYLVLSPEKKVLATSSIAQIRDYAVKKSYEVFEQLDQLRFKLLEKKDIPHPGHFLNQLKTRSDLFTKLLKERFSMQVQAAINNYTEGVEVGDDVTQSLVNELNSNISGKILYDANTFEGLTLSPQIQALAERSISPGASLPSEEIIFINRSILEDVYQGDIKSVVLPEEFSFLTDKVKDEYQRLHKSLPEVMDVRSVLLSFFNKKELLETIEDHYRQEIIDLKDMMRGTIQLGLDLRGGISVTVQADFESMEKDTGSAMNDKEKEDAMNRVLEILNNRIDQFGVTEPQIRRLGTSRILIEIPGIADPERIRRIILGKGRLNFHIVDRDGTQKFQDYYRAHPTDFLAPDGLSLKDPTILPPGTVIRPIVEKDKYGVDVPKGYAVIKEEVALSGNYIKDATTRNDPTTMRPYVTFTLTNDGGDLFYKVTSANKGEILAVVLDDKIKFQATISGPIHSAVQVSGTSFDAKEASDLALILRTGALPVPLEVIEQQAVGASLGEDAIGQGLNASMWGVMAVALFMLIYYRRGGLNAVVALALNIFFMAAALSMFNFTLTLPSIAGFVLNIGMAVDANVIIFERIKEEWAVGKSRKAAVNAGFSKAFLTIIDSNMTTAIAALALAMFGKGPIQGFAIVLLIGLVSSVFTAVFVSRLIFDFFTDVFKAQKIRLGWGVSK